MGNEEARKEIMHGIATDAGIRAAAVIAEAEKAAGERIRAAESQAERTGHAAEEKTARQTVAIEREAATRLSATRRRMQLEMMERIYQLVISRCTEELGKLAGSGEYGKVLQEWIIQAAAGLRVESASVNCTSPERETVAAVLKKAEEKVRQVTGLQVTLTLAGWPPLAGQGIVVTSSDGRTAFNNQVASRLFRFQSEIRKLVHDRLF